MNQLNLYSHSWFLQIEQCKDSCVYTDNLVYVLNSIRIQDKDWDRTMTFWNSQQHKTTNASCSQVLFATLLATRLNQFWILGLGIISLKLWISGVSKNQPSSKVLLWISLDMGGHWYRPTQLWQLWMWAGWECENINKTTLSNASFCSHSAFAHPSTKLILGCFQK